MVTLAKKADNGISQSNKQGFRNPWVLGWISLVVVVLAVNIFMISLAFTTNPGLVVKDYYEKGQDYERTVATQIAARSALGWNVKLDVPEDTLAGQTATYRFAATDKVGRPLIGANVEIQAYRPSDAGADFLIPLVEGTPGVYEASITLPLKGIWDFIVKVNRGEDNYEFTRRVTIGG